jgi:hypothetical protein
MLNQQGALRSYLRLYGIFLLLNGISIHGCLLHLVDGVPLFSCSHLCLSVLLALQIPSPLEQGPRVKSGALGPASCGLYSPRVLSPCVA